MFNRVIKSLVVVGAVLTAMSAKSANAGVVFFEDFSTTVDGTQNVPGWSVSGSATVYNSHDVATAGLFFNQTGTGQFLSFGAFNVPNTGVASPNVPLNAGQTYQLSFLYGAVGYPNISQSLAISVAGAVVTIVTTAGSTTDLSQLFNEYLFTFVAPGSGPLAFVDVSDETFSVDGELDNILLTTDSSISVPEPSSFALICTVLLLFFGFGQVRSRAEA